MQKSQNNSYGVWILFRSVMQKLRSSEPITTVKQPSSTRQRCTSTENKINLQRLQNVVFSLVIFAMNIISGSEAEGQAKLCWNPSRHPFLGQVSNLDLLLCRGFCLEYEDMLQCLIFIPVNDWKIEPLLRSVTYSCKINKKAFSHEKNHRHYGPKFTNH